MRKNAGASSAARAPAAPATPAVPPAQPLSPEQLWPEQWTVQAWVEANRLEHHTLVALANCSAAANCANSARRTANGVALTCQRERSKAAIDRHLAEVRAACRRTGKQRWNRTKLRGRRGFMEYLRGTQVERAYRSLHAAKVSLVDLLSDTEVDTVKEDVLARIGIVMGRTDPRRTAAEKALVSCRSLAGRVALKQAMETAYDASDEEYTRLRNFRNILWGTAALVLVFLALMVVSVALRPDALPLCFSPDRTSSTGVAQDDRRVCPSGESVEPEEAAVGTGGAQDGAETPREPAPIDLPIVAGIGAIGASLAALLAVRNLRGSSTPYSIPVALAMLKVPAGALTAVVGMLLLGGEFAPGLSNLDSQRQILAYALVFGYAQQALTGFVDNRAQSILNKLPSTDPEAKTPEPPIAERPGPEEAPDVRSAGGRGAGSGRRAPWTRLWLGRRP
ncbi:MAG TPA: hypothetical protein VFM55_13330 [Micromonosporaceae bacterium]|nr:hypothetical protein [Micromonosporaceae bacterium]